MSKGEAMAALQQGHKVAHRFFLPGEYIYIKDGKIRDEANSLHESFWSIRISEHWEKDWLIVNVTPKTKDK